MDEEYGIPSPSRYFANSRRWISRKDLGLIPFRMPTWFPVQLQGKFLDRFGTALGAIMARILGYSWPKYHTIRLPEYLHTLPDGAKQATDVYLPRPMYDNQAKVSTVLIRLPYWKDQVTILGRIFASQGYACVLQDIRGTGHSTPFGTSSFSVSDRDDGLETLNWISRQFWYNGKIGMWGASYIGETQWALAWDNGGLLTCINPGICCFNNLWSSWNGLNINGLNAAIAKILINTCGAFNQPADNEALDKWGFTTKMVADPRATMYNDPMEDPKTRSVLNLDELKGKSIQEKQDLFNERMGVHLDFAKRDYDDFYQIVYKLLCKREMTLFDHYMPGNLDVDVSKINVPILSVAGWQDMFLEHQIRDYQELMVNLPESAKEQYKLIIGPWAHGQVGNMGEHIGIGGLFDMARALFPLPFYEYHLKGTSGAWEKEPRVKYFVIGRNIWRKAKNWPPSGTVPVGWYLHSGGNANSKFGDGSLSADEPIRESADMYFFNPMDPVITTGGRNLDLPKGAMSQDRVERRQDVLVYTSPKLDKGFEVAGLVTLNLWASSSAIDTDFMAKLCDVSPRGKSINILDTGIRCRFRDGPVPMSLEPDEIYEFTIELGNIAIYFRKWHRLRLQITSSNFPRFDVNSNLGGKQSAKGYDKAHQRIYHSEGKATVLLLPVIPE